MLPRHVTPSLHLEIDVKGHEEVDGCTYYELHCAFTCKLVEGSSSGRSAWISHRRLAELREELHSPIKATLTEKSYGIYFGATPFARRGGVPGTTARLDSWCRALAQVVSTGELPPAQVINILKALGSPVDDPFVALSGASFSNMESDLSDLPDASENEPDAPLASEAQALITTLRLKPSAENKEQGEQDEENQTQDNDEENDEEDDEEGEDDDEDEESELEVEEDGEQEEEHTVRKDLDDPPESVAEILPMHSMESEIAFPLNAETSEEDLAVNEEPMESTMTQDEATREEEHDETTDFFSTTSSEQPMSSPDSSPLGMPAPIPQSRTLPIYGPFESFPYGVPAIPDLPSFWTRGSVETFRVRDVGYLKGREKTPSGFAIYEAVAADAIRSDEKISEIMNKLPAGAETFASPSGAPAWSPSWGVPRILVVNAQLPYKSGSLLGSHPADDAGFSLISYHVLSAQAAELLARDELIPALHIWRRFVEAGASTKDGVTFKALGHVQNLSELAVPRIVHQFNAKPVAVTKSATIVKQHLPETLEIAFDVREWAYLARKSLVSLGGMAKSAVVDIGYVIEGKCDTDLPEHILAHFTMHYADIERVWNLSNSKISKSDVADQCFAPQSRK